MKAIFCSYLNYYKFSFLFFFCGCALLLFSVTHSVNAQSNPPVLASAILNINDFVISNSVNNTPLNVDTDFQLLNISNTAALSSTLNGVTDARTNQSISSIDLLATCTGSGCTPVSENDYTVPATALSQPFLQYSYADQLQQGALFAQPSQNISAGINTNTRADIGLITNNSEGSSTSSTGAATSVRFALAAGITSINIDFNYQAYLETFIDANLGTSSTSFAQTAISWGINLQNLSNPTDGANGNGILLNAFPQEINVTRSLSIPIANPLIYNQAGSVRFTVNDLNSTDLYQITIDHQARADATLGLAPAIDIRKQEEGDDTRTVTFGADVDFTIVVTNTGGLALNNVVVSDDLVPGCARTIGDLALSESIEYSCTVTNVTEDFTNQACVSGTSNGTQVTDCDNSSVTVPTMPAIDIRKQEEGPDTRTVTSGTDVDFTIVVTNTGDVALSNVAVSDDLVPGCARTIGDLALSESIEYSCTATNVTSAFTNQACVSGTSNGTQVTDCDNSSVTVPTMPAIDIRKQEEGPDTRSVLSGSDVDFTIVVTNIGNVALSDVAVTDAAVPSCDLTIGDLGIAQSTTFSCTATNVTEDFTNQACVSGVGNNTMVSDCDDSTVIITTPPPPEEIPTLSQYALLLTVLLLMLITQFRLRRNP